MQLAEFENALFIDSNVYKFFHFKDFESCITKLFTNKLQMV